MRLLSWNVNGVRAIVRKDELVPLVEREQPDVLCIQETKAKPEQIDGELLEGYDTYWNSAEKAGYSGVATFTRVEPLDVRLGMNSKVHDSEGRILTLEFEDFFLVNCYTPNSGRELARLEYRAKKWEPAFRRFLKKLDKEKPVVVCGDLNVAHQEIDLANPKSNRKNAGFTDEERAEFGKLLKADFVDSFRHLYPDKTDAYTWWSYVTGARKRNVGWRIDYFCLSERMADRVEEADILADIMGSDHCPVGLVLK